MIVRVLGGLLVLVLAVSCALLEVFYLPLRAASIPLPLSVLAAIIGNVLFTRAMYAVTGSILAALLPGMAWLAIIARSAISRPEGDLLITDGHSSTALAVVNLAFMVLGLLALAFEVGALSRRHRVRRTRRTSPEHTAGTARTGASLSRLRPPGSRRPRHHQAPQ